MAYHNLLAEDWSAGTPTSFVLIVVALAYVASTKPSSAFPWSKSSGHSERSTPSSLQISVSPSARAAVAVSPCWMGHRLFLELYGHCFVGPVSHTSKCVASFGSKKMMQILRSLCTDTGSWFSSLCPVVFSDRLFRDEAVECESLALL